MVHVGVNGKARKVNDIFVGVESVARRVSKIYVGVNGVARLCYEDLIFPIGTVFDFPYTGVVQPVTLPRGKYKLEVWGAQGGERYSGYGGRGGYSVGTIDLKNQTNIFVYVGNKPPYVGTARSVVPGGFNGGGNGFNRNYEDYSTYAQGGGGATDIRIGVDDLYSRVIVAGGGAGSEYYDLSIHNYGGGITSGDYNANAYKATQESAGPGGSFGQGASSPTAGYNYNYGPPGAGGGWYGGGLRNGYSDSDYDYLWQVGGGSGYVYTAATAGYYPTGCLLNPSYYLKDAKTIDGSQSFIGPTGKSETGHTGNGYARITYLGKPDKS